MYKKVLLTGAAGFIGSHTCERLLKEGYQIIGVDNLNNYYDHQLKQYNLNLLKKYDNFQFCKENISNFNNLKTIFKKYDISMVIHLAAQAGVRYSLENPFEYQKSNVEGTLNLLELCRHQNVTNVIFASSSSVYGERNKVPFKEDDRIDKPVSMYAATKQAGEALCYTYSYLYDLNINCLRFFTVYGPRGRPDMAPYIFTHAVLTKQVIKFYDTSISQIARDFTYVDDIVEGIMLSLTYWKGFEIFNLGFGSPLRTIDFIKTIEDIIGIKAQIEFVGRQPGDVAVTYADTSKAKQLLGFNPHTSVKEGMKKYLKWFRDYYNV